MDGGTHGSDGLRGRALINRGPRGAGPSTEGDHIMNDTNTTPAPGLPEALGDALTALAMAGPLLPDPHSREQAAAIVNSGRAALAEPHACTLRTYSIKVVKPLGPRQRKHTVLFYRTCADSRGEALAAMRAELDDRDNFTDCRGWRIVAVHESGDPRRIALDSAITCTPEQAAAWPTL